MYSKVFFFLIFASISCRSIYYLSSREMGCIHTTANTDFNIMGRQITSKSELMSIKFVSLGVSDSVFAEGIIKNPTTLTPVPNVHIIVGHPSFNGNDYSVTSHYEAQSNNVGHFDLRGPIDVEDCVYFVHSDYAVEIYQVGYASRLKIQCYTTREEK